VPIDAYPEIHLVRFGPPTTLTDGTVFPRLVEFLVSAEGDRPVLDGVLEVIDGRPVLARLALTRAQDASEITGSTLRSVNVSGLLEDVVRRTAEVASSLVTLANLEAPRRPPAARLDDVESAWGPDLPFHTGLAEARAIGVRAAALPAQRRPSEAQLREVAEIVRANPDEPRKQVARQLYLTERTASRRIAAAQKAGYFEEEDR
jgi:hypothetical protein